MLDLMFKSLKSISSFSLLMAMFIFIWGLMGMELFAYLAVTDEDGNLIDAKDV